MKKIIYNILLTIVLVLAINISMHAQDATMDSLQQIVNTKSGKEKLKTLAEIAHFIRNDNEECLPQFNLFEDEARTQKNDAMLGKALFYKVQYYTRKKALDSVYHYYEESKKIDMKDKVLKYHIETLLINAYMNDNKAEYALMHLNKRMSDEAYGGNTMEEALTYATLGSIHYRMRNYTAAKEAILRSIETLRIAKDIPSEYDKLLNMTKEYSTLTNTFVLCKNFDLAIIASDSARYYFQQLKSFEPNPKSSISLFDEYTTIARANAFIEKNELLKARFELDRLEARYSYSTHGPIPIWCREAEALYHFSIGKYDIALQYTERFETENSAEASQHTTSQELELLRSKILYKLKRKGEAYQLLSKVADEREAEYSKDLTPVLAKMQTLYEMDKKKAEIEVQAAELQQNKVIIISLIFFLLLFISLACAMKRNATILKKKNKQLYEQYATIDSYLSEIKKLTLLHKEKEIGKNEKGDFMEQLSSKIEDYLKTSLEFRSLEMSRDYLARKMGTNRQYVTDAIKARTGKTFNEYISGLRLEYAHNQLIIDKVVSISDVCVDSGFINIRTFNRAFKERYGMSPSELREVIKGIAYL